eukprot:Gregarina_sp_Poly_1__9439@NODE_591_length_7352_cov_125_609883_g456_i0_p2_GENE_NODE_591_length_7352_cov_125_609883_g456_i0NODE_591_length_7352_cov_125_609883_g456_i0_p2_ORF_typecomplete_len530_score93_16DEAD/PF00270_29/3_1e14DEAD/PF00270_29/9_1e02Helicase_C/PF00271_31/4_1e02Helicase_C/PF00271_31/4_6e03Helicase_C/PF00271_31/3_5e10ResIII/PF04851_15/2_1e05SNF2_N/PF00176_23/0_0025SNF2_N/PF00176_23/1_6e03ERCC3_RAD25_C/PF16203_5/0_007_NODE_591_length_7352_cov_125_609883_g456_i050316620
MLCWTAKTYVFQLPQPVASRCKNSFGSPIQLRIFMTYCLNLLISDPESVCIVVYPTKALAQDQLAKWELLIGKMAEADPFLPEIRTRVVDGDTDYRNRKLFTAEANILLTNFDFLHKTALVTKNQFTRLLRKLRFLVVDEAHTYRGMFGAHSALCLRRLLLMSHHLQDAAVREAELQDFSKGNSVPKARTQILTCTATLGNPLHHFSLLTGRDSCACVLDDGAPSESKYFALWDPPRSRIEAKNPAIATLKDLWAVEKPPSVASTVNLDNTPNAKANAKSKAVTYLEPRDLMEKKFRQDLKITEENESFKISAINEAIRIFMFMVQRRVKTFLFCNARILVEIIFNAVQKKLAKDKKLLNMVVSYRGGYTKEIRRSLERRIFHNEVYGVISTNALELGIDLGLLDVVITLGFEGSVSSVRQRLGRAGRSKRPSLGVLVAFDSPVERYVIKKLGTDFWQKKPEPVIFDPYNVILQKQHLICALKELNEAVKVEELRMFLGQGFPEALKVALRTGEARQCSDSSLQSLQDI